MGDTPFQKGKTLSELDRRTFVAGLGAAAGGIVAASAFPGSAVAGLTAEQTAGPAGMIGIAGRITNKLGLPEKGAYVEIQHHRVGDWRPGSDGSKIYVETWEGPDWFGVWTDDNGVFGLHTWWSTDDAVESELDTAQAIGPAQVFFQIETRSGERLQRTMWLEPNPNRSIYNPDDPSTLTPVAWSEREQSAQYVANFTIA